MLINLMNLLDLMRYFKKGKEVFKEFSSIEDLMDFVKQYKQVVIYDNTIEIYDDYRE